MSDRFRSQASQRISWLIVVMAAVFAALCIRLWWLQVVDYDKYLKLSQNNHTRLVRDRAQRGRITDRNGTAIATTRPGFGVFIIPEDCPKTARESVFSILSELLDSSSEDIAKRFKSQQSPSFTPRKIASNLDFETVVRIESHRFELPGVSVMAENIRYYPHNSTLCHLLGYMGQISQNQLNSDKYAAHYPGDFIGQFGVESKLETELAGFDGSRWVQVDSQGRIGHTLKSPVPQLARPGSEVELTIDLDLQLSIEEVLSPWTGTIIALDPRNGEILAMASNPGFDPNWFAGGITLLRWRELASNLEHPLFNRAIQVATCPGSVFKVVTAIAGLRNGTLNASTGYLCQGSYKYFGNSFKCWKKGGHGSVDLVRALEASCNVFFYQAGLKAGIDAISETAQMLGLNQKTKIDLPNEVSGLIPSREWKLREKHDEWWSGETISVAIGQGGVQVTPVQIVNMMAAVANKGVQFVPRVIRRVSPNPSPEKHWGDPVILNQFELSDSAWQLIHQGLYDVVNGPSGTARDVRTREFLAAGKTGTAQVISDPALKVLGYSRENVPKKYRDHNWFAGFAPIENPQIAIVVFLENGGREGAKAKAKIARKVFQKWYEVTSAGRYGPEPPDTDESEFEELDNGSSVN